MSIYGISDLHLSLVQPFVAQKGESPQEYKPMSIFGAHWQNHVVRLYENWQQTIGKDDTVLVPGDLSWAMHLEECTNDFDFLRQLNGHLILCKGNHDYWWESKKKIDAILPANVTALQHQSILLEDTVLSATRGWLCQGSKEYGRDDEKIMKRELLRLEMALQEGKKMRVQAKKQLEDKQLEHWVMLHFRPVNDQLEKSGFVELMETYGVSRCFYGHLHGNPVNNVLSGTHWGIDFQLLSCDYLGFQPLLLK